MYKTRKTRQNIYFLAISEAHVCNTIFKLYSLDFNEIGEGHDLTINWIGITKRSLMNKSYLDINHASPRHTSLAPPSASETSLSRRLLVSFHDYRKFQSLLVCPLRCLTLCYLSVHTLVANIFEYRRYLEHEWLK